MIISKYILDAIIIIMTLISGITAFKQINFNKIKKLLSKKSIKSKIFFVNLFSIIIFCIVVLLTPLKDHINIKNSIKHGLIAALIAFCAYLNLFLEVFWIIVAFTYVFSLSI